MSDFVRQWAEQEAPDKRRYGPNKILAWAGPILEVAVTLPWEQEEEFGRCGVSSPPPAVGIGFIDTGATYTGIDQAVIKELRLQPTGVDKGFATATGRRTVKPTYAVRVIFPGTSFPDFPVATASPHGLGRLPFLPMEITGRVVVILGRDFLANYVFTYDGPDGKFTLSRP
jgi:hypothetical protein